MSIRENCHIVLVPTPTLNFGEWDFVVKCESMQ